METPLLHSHPGPEVVSQNIVLASILVKDSFEVHEGETMTGESRNLSLFA